MADKNPSSLTAITPPISRSAVAHFVESGNSRKASVEDIVGWVLADSWTYASDVTEVDFTDLGDYSELRVMLDAVTLGTSGTRNLLVSTDNGATFLTTSGDYQTVSSTGTVSNATSVALHGTSSTSARYAEILIRNTNLAYPKSAHLLTGGSHIRIPTTSVINALRVFPSAGGNINGGSIYVFGR